MFLRADQCIIHRLTDIDHVDVMSEEFGSDINVVASALKLWFRELPEPLLTNDLYQRFIDAAGEYKQYKHAP